MDKSQRLLKQRIHRKNTNNFDNKRYEKSPKGFLMRTYRNMQSRVEGIQKREAKFYMGLPILSREDFYTWSLSTDSDFHGLHTRWTEANYDRRLSPSIDRIDVTLGYVLENMQWITHSANSGKLTRRCVGEAHCGNKYSKDTIVAVRANYAHGCGLTQIAREYNIPVSTIDAIVKRRVWKHLEESL